MSKVYVVQEDPKKNILPAKRFGELEILLPEGSQIMFSPGPVVETLNRKLQAYGDNDFLLCIGDPAAIGIATAVASRWNQGKVRLLKWDRQERDYYEVSFNVFS
jgi:hypothetical protein